ncbi:alanine racemase [Ectobacillus ponti]|uniref:Alanine racemase n=1 Tax=Ectobacillus ponti TaxID=2961894 RepID=A0AA41X990_9BACI|nr:alanine racemase [Ectobacillus ponti]MCP8971249.1 alanine racemase [Ectobacillus ponti]
MKESSFYRDTWAEIDLDAVYENVQNAKQHIPAQAEVIAVVKANAYGHGAAPVARTALEAGATRVAVAFLDEALSLRRAGITAPILVLGASRPQDMNIAAAHNIALTVFQSEWLQQAAEVWKAEQQLRIHLKFDTGMGRLGIRTKEECSACSAWLRQMPAIEVEGAFTHFATADERQTDYFEKQYQRFLEQLHWLQEEGVQPRMIHCANSAASLRFTERIFNAARIGIAMYGLTPSPEINTLLPYPLKEAFSLHSKIVQVKQVEPGQGISYGATYVTAGTEWIATVPIGYADGWVRRMQNFEVLVDGKKVPIVGRVCMDQLMLRLPEHLPAGTKVTLIGRQGGQMVSVNDVAAHLGTINYEVPCLINFRVPRVFRRDGEVVEIENLLNP